MRPHHIKDQLIIIVSDAKITLHIVNLEPNCTTMVTIKPTLVTP